MTAEPSNQHSSYVFGDFKVALQQVVNFAGGIVPAVTGAVEADWETHKKVSAKVHAATTKPR